VSEETVDAGWSMAGKPHPKTCQVFETWQVFLDGESKPIRFLKTL
jgi:hypothetical protein